MGNKAVKIEVVDMVRALEKCNRQAEETKDPKWSPPCDTCLLYQELWLSPNAEYYAAFNDVRIKVSPCLLLGELCEAIEEAQKRRKKKR